MKLRGLLALEPATNKRQACRGGQLHYWVDLAPSDKLELSPIVGGGAGPFSLPLDCTTHKYTYMGWYVPKWMYTYLLRGFP